MSSHVDVQQLWQKRVATANQHYLERSLELLALVTGSKSSRLRNFDVRQAIRQACKRETLARNKYMRALRIYTHLVVYGTMPEEPTS
jgi:hypothetical protein